VVFGRPGWRPADVAARFPVATLDPARPGRFDPEATPTARALAIACFVVALGATTAFLWEADTLPVAVRAIGVVALTALLWLSGALLQGRLPAMLGAAGLAAVGATAGAALAAAQAGGLDWATLGRACKPLVLGLAAAWAWRRWRASDAADARAHALLLAALVASLAGDVALMVSGGFLPGLVAFLFAHVAYVMLFARGVGAMPSRSAAFAVAVYGLAMLAVLWPHLPAGLRGPVAAYVAVISAMGAQAIGRALVQRDAASVATAAGALLFVASDTVLALDRFVAPVPLAPFWILSTYFTAQLLIARHALPDPPARRAASLPVHVAG
jgi:uncharacterized membrane protein YhhN